MSGGFSFHWNYNRIKPKKLEIDTSNKNLKNIEVENTSKIANNLLTNQSERTVETLDFSKFSNKKAEETVGDDTLKTTIEKTYLQTFHLPYSNITELKDSIGTIENKETKEQYQKIADYMEKETTHYLKNIYPTISKKNYQENRFFNNNSLNRINTLKEQAISSDINYQTLPTISLNTKEDVVTALSCIINKKGGFYHGNLISNATVYDIKSEDNFFNELQTLAPFMSEYEKGVFNYQLKEEGIDTAYRYLNDIKGELQERTTKNEFSFNPDSIYKKIYELTTRKEETNTDDFLRNREKYGCDQEKIAPLVTYSIKNLEAITEDKDFLTFLKTEKNDSIEESQNTLDSLKNSSPNNKIAEDLLEYIYKKCDKNNDFNIIEKVENSLSINMERETTELLKETRLARNMTEMEMIKTLSSLENTDLSSYEATVNEIFSSYKNNEKEFKEDFGYPLYNEKNELNTEKMLLELYVYKNEKKDDTINSFLQTKNKNLNRRIDASYTYDNEHLAEKKEIEKLKTDIKDYLKEKNTHSIHLDVFPNEKKEFHFINSENKTTVIPNNWEKGKKHALTITGVEEENLIVSSWGDRYVLPLEDLIENKCQVTFIDLEGVS